MNALPPVRVCDREGFSLLEAMVALTLSGVVVAGIFAVTSLCAMQWQTTDLYLGATYEAGHALECMVYGRNGQGGLREADGIALTGGADGWTANYKDADGASRSFRYDSGRRVLVFTPGTVTVSTGVAWASVLTNAAGSGANLRVDLVRHDKCHTWTNSLTTFVAFRNRMER